MAAEEDVPLGDAARHYEQQFGAKIRQVRKGGAGPPARPPGLGTPLGLIAAGVFVIALLARAFSGPSHQPPAYQFTPPPPQIDFEQQRQVFERLQQLNPHLGQPRDVFQPGPEEEGPSYHFEENDLLLPEGLCYRVVREVDVAEQFNPGKRVWEVLDGPTRDLVRRAARGERLGRAELDGLRTALNELLDRRDFYSTWSFRGVNLPEDARALARRLGDGGELTEAEVRQLNRLALEAAYPRQLLSAKGRHLCAPRLLQMLTDTARRDLEEARRQDGARRP